MAAAMEFALAAPTVMVIRREFAAPRALVWRAWTDPAHLVRWFGPHGFTSSVAELDLRPGGRFRIVMRGPDGTDYPVNGIYREIVPPVRLVYTDVSWDDPRKEALVTVTLFEKAGRTLLTKHTEFASQADRDAMVALGAEGGWRETFVRLDLLLAAAAG